jgi:hypothetical protein
MRAARLRYLALAAAFLLPGCAATREPTPSEEASRVSMDKILARMVSKGELDKAQRMADSLSASKEPAEREIAAYWKAVAWLYRDEPDSALVILEANQNKWTGGMRKVHTGLLLSLAKESSQSRAASRVRVSDANKAATPDKSMQERIESLQKETGDLRAENARLETEKEKYQKLLKDLETIR